VVGKVGVGLLAAQVEVDARHRQAVLLDERAEQVLQVEWVAGDDVVEGIETQGGGCGGCR
jgi:hypothetical protein